MFSNATGTKTQISLQQPTDATMNQISEVSANLPDSQLFEQTGVLVWINKSTRKVERLDRQSLSLWLRTYITFIRYNAKGEASDISMPSYRIVRACLELLPKQVPHLQTIYEHPIIMPDLSLRSEEGYYADIESYIFDNSGITDESIDSSTESLDRAKSILSSDLLGEVLFKDTSAGTNYLAYLLTFAMRPAIEGNVPMFAINSSSMAIGKTYLLRTADMIWRNDDNASALHIDAKVLNNTKSAYREVCFALERNAESIYFDNMGPKPIRANYLAPLLTDGRFQYKRPGETSLAKQTCQAIISIAGNNLRFEKDLARRVYWCELEDFKMQFFEGDMLQYAKEHRISIIRSLFTLIKYWKDQGAPRSEIVFQSFNEWASIIGGILESVGIQHFLESSEDPEITYMKRYCEAIYNEMGDGHFSVPEILDIISEDDHYLGSKNTDRSRTLRFGRLLSVYNDIQLGEYRISKSPSNTYPRKYRIIKSAE